MTTRNLSLVTSPPPVSRGVDIHDVQHVEIKAIDWGRVHLEAARNPPIHVGRFLGRWTMPVSRKDKS